MWNTVGETCLSVSGAAGCGINSITIMRSEIATGRVQVLDMPDAQAKRSGCRGNKTNGIIFHLWPKGAKSSDGSVQSSDVCGA